MAFDMALVTGMYLVAASEVPELSAKYFTRPGQVTFVFAGQRLLPPAVEHFVVVVDGHVLFVFVVKLPVGAELDRTKQLFEMIRLPKLRELRLSNQLTEYFSLLAKGIELPQLERHSITEYRF